MIVLEVTIAATLVGKDLVRYQFLRCRQSTAIAAQLHHARLNDLTARDGVFDA